MGRKHWSLVQRESWTCQGWDFVKRPTKAKSSGVGSPMWALQGWGSARELRKEQPVTEDRTPKALCKLSKARARTEANSWTPDQPKQGHVDRQGEVMVT